MIQLTKEEGLILQRASEIMARIGTEALYPLPTGPVYAVGNADEQGNLGFVDGPTPDLKGLIANSLPEVINTNHSPFYIFDLTTEPAKKLYKWFPAELKWKKLKQ